MAGTDRRWPLPGGQVGGRKSDDMFSMRGGQLLVSLGLALVLLAGSLAAPAPASAATSSAEKAGEWEMWCLVNSERRSRGIRPLLMSVDLHTELARPWSETQARAGRIFHRSDLGGDTSRSIGSWDRVGENVGSYDSVARLHAALMASSDHRANLLSSSYEYIGIGITFSGRTWGTQNFVSRGTTAPTSALPVGQRFVDVCSDSDYFSDIGWMYDNRVTTGYTMRLANGHAYRDFRPRTTVNRSQLAAFLYRVANASGTYGSCDPYPFSDVASNDPFRDEICWMHNRGLTGENTTFQPGAAANRQAMAAWMYRVWDGIEGNEFTPPPAPTFSDVPPVHPYYDAIEWMADSGISIGYSDGTWRPEETVKRQVMAAFFHRAAAYI